MGLCVWRFTPFVKRERLAALLPEPDSEENGSGKPISAKPGREEE
jgi:hypothetical protein